MQSGSILNINSVKVVLFGEYHHIWVVSHRDHLGSGLSSFWPNRKQKVHLHFHTTMIFFQSFSLQLPLASFTTPPCFLVGAPSLGPEPPCSQIQEIHKNFNFSCKILTSKSHLASYPTLAPLESKEEIVSYLTGLLYLPLQWFDFEWRLQSPPLAYILHQGRDFHIWLWGWSN